MSKIAQDVLFVFKNIKDGYAEVEKAKSNQIELNSYLNKIVKKYLNQTTKSVQ